MWIEAACNALRQGKRLDLHYDGFARSVEVHAVGYSKTGHAIMRVWQVRGGSASRERSGWKLMRLDEARGASLSSEDAQGPRRGYKRGDKDMDRIVCEL